MYIVRFLTRRNGTSALCAVSAAATADIADAIVCPPGSTAVGIPSLQLQ